MKQTATGPTKKDVSFTGSENVESAHDSTGKSVEVLQNQDSFIDFLRIDRLFQDNCFKMNGTHKSNAILMFILLMSLQGKLTTQ